MRSDVEARHAALMDELTTLIKSVCNANVWTRRRRAIKPGDLDKLYRVKNDDGTERYFSVTISKTTNTPGETVTDASGQEYAITRKYGFMIFLMLGFLDESKSAASEDEVRNVADSILEAMEDDANDPNSFRAKLDASANCLVHPGNVTSYAPVHIGENNFFSTATVNLILEEKLIQLAVEP